MHPFYIIFEFCTVFTHVQKDCSAPAILKIACVMSASCPLHATGITPAIQRACHGQCTVNVTVMNVDWMWIECLVWHRLYLDYRILQGLHRAVNVFSCNNLYLKFSIYHWCENDETSIENDLLPGKLEKSEIPSLENCHGNEAWWGWEKWWRKLSGCGSY